MLTKDVLTRFRALHEKRKHDGLGPEESSLYAAWRDDLYSAILRAQRLALPPGQKPRQAVRVALVLKIQLAFAESRLATVTCDVGLGGFAAFVNGDFAEGSRCEFTLNVPGQALRGHARIVGCVRHGTGGVTHRASFAFEPMPDDSQARLEIAVLDAALRSLTT